MNDRIRLTKEEKAELLKDGQVYIERNGLELFIEFNEYDERGYCVTVMDRFTIVNVKKEDTKNEQ